MRTTVATMMLAMCATTALCEPITIDWETVGGSNSFERQAVTFAPILITSFVSLHSGGVFQSLVHTEGVTFEAGYWLAQVFARIDSHWTSIGGTNASAGPPGSVLSVEDLPLSFSSIEPVELSGINMTSGLGGATNYTGMNSWGTGTQFTFDYSEIPEPSTLLLLAFPLVGVFCKESVRSRPLARPMVVFTV